MKFVYPLDLEPGKDSIAVQSDDNQGPKYEPVTATYREGDVVIVETAAKQRLRCDPGLKVQAFRPVGLIEWP